MIGQIEVALVAAMAENGVIGRNNELPWHLPADLQYFKKITLGKPIIMGRKTYESIGRPLPGRANIVVSRQTDYRIDGASVAGSLKEAVDAAVVIAKAGGQREVMLIGGAELYRQALPLADRIYLTRVNLAVDGDAFFPEVNWSNWCLVSRENHQSESPGQPDYSFCIYESKGDAVKHK